MPNTITAIDKVAFNHLLSQKPMNSQHRSVQHFDDCSELNLYATLIAVYTPDNFTVTVKSSKEAAEKEPALKTKMSKRVINAIRILTRDSGFTLKDI